MFAHIRTRGAINLFAFHPANGGWRSKTEGAILKSMGVVAGTPDLFAVHQGRCYAMEIKAEGGRATEAQFATIAALEKAGAYTCVAEGLDRALAVLEQWGLLRGRVA